MMKLMHLAGLIVCLSLSNASFALTLNGIASYELLRKEIYIAALYLIEPSDNPHTILTSSQSKRMAIKVTAKRWSPRRWSRMWQNDIAINNPFASDDELTNQLMLFSGFLDSPLTQGDEILIDYIATQGTSISINNVKIIQTPTSQLFNYLLNVWIGKLPPSGNFKRRILSANNDELGQALKSRFNSINYTNQRSLLISSWIKARKDAELAVLNARAKAQAKALAKLAVEKAKEKQEKTRELKAQQKAKAVALTPPKPIKTYVAPKKKINKKKKPHKPKKIASLKTVNTAKSKKQLAAQDLYYWDLYQWELRREIRSTINYPPWAQKFGQKGTVKMAFTVNRKAQVSNLVNENDNISELLVGEVKNAISDVVPFILPPDALSGSEWAFSFSYQFDPKDSAQSYLKKPRMPTSLLSNNKLTRAQYNQILSLYIDDIKAAIGDRIEYPVWSKKLNHRGSVEIEIKINREGLVQTSKDITLTRHESLNQEVRNAIEQSQPLPPIPEALKLNSTKVKVKYKFK